MIGKLNALGDRMLGMLLPKTSADAIACRGQVVGHAGSCTFYCYRWGDRSQYMKQCETRDCTHVCYDCC
jgi:hypothetical protein